MTTMMNLFHNLLNICYTQITFLFTYHTVPPNILDIESTPSSVAVRENQSINMTCRADGFPTPKIIWRREDGQSITVERKKKGLNELTELLTDILSSLFVHHLLQ